jgi:transposase-like protein
MIMEIQAQTTASTPRREPWNKGKLIGQKPPLRPKHVWSIRTRLRAFYDFPAEHWKHLRTTNPIESTFATVRHRTIRSKGCLSNKTALAMVFKLVEGAQKSWRRIDGPNQLPKLIQGVKFADGIEVTGNSAVAQAQAAA